MGHLDFYPNNGQQQPGCPADLFAKIKASVWSTVTQLDILGIYYGFTQINFEWMSDCCLTPIQQFFSYIMVRTS